MALPFTLKSILRQKKNYGNSNIAPCKNIIFQKPSKRNQNPTRRYYNSIITNLKFQHKPKTSSFKRSSHKNRPIIIIITYGSKSIKLLYSLYNESKHNILCLGRQGQQETNRTLKERVQNIPISHFC